MAFFFSCEANLDRKKKNREIKDCPPCMSFFYLFVEQ